MLNLMIACPKTHKYISTGAAMTMREWEATTVADLSGTVQCPSCDGEHAWDKGDVSIYSAS
jgi:hypothetical protein